MTNSCFLSYILREKLARTDQDSMVLGQMILWSSTTPTSCKLSYAIFIDFPLTLGLYTCIVTSSHHNGTLPSLHFIFCLCFSELLKGDSDGLLKLPTDKVLADHPAFRPYVELYAKVNQTRIQNSAHPSATYNFLQARWRSTDKAKRVVTRTTAVFAVVVAVIACAYICETKRKLG